MYLTDLFTDDHYMQNPMHGDYVFNGSLQSRPAIKPDVNKQDARPPLNIEFKQELAKIQASLQSTDGFLLLLNKKKDIVRMTYFDKKLSTFFRSTYLGMTAKQRLQTWQKIVRIIEDIDNKERVQNE
jgi:hypothetical protein|tara:strand:- start:107 stop:487 length:381 start_codon:yes stop_codon:yes gene_type:complete